MYSQSFEPRLVESMKPFLLGDFYLMNFYLRATPLFALNMKLYYQRTFNKSQ